MSRDGCEVTFSGQYGGTYNVACDQVEYINEELINVGSNSTIYLYPDTTAAGTNSPYIALRSMSYPRYYSSNSYNYTEITNVSHVSFNGMSNMYRDSKILSSGTSIILIVFCLISLLIKK